MADTHPPFTAVFFKKRGRFVRRITVVDTDDGILLAGCMQDLEDVMDTLRDEGYAMCSTWTFEKVEPNAQATVLIHDIWPPDDWTSQTVWN